MGEATRKHMSKKVVILCNPRSGSQMLYLALEQQPELKMFGEILCTSGEWLPKECADILKRRYGFADPQQMKFDIRGDDYRKMATAEYVYEVLRDHCDVCKIMYTQLLNRDILHMLHDCQVRVIHLVREDILASYVSILTAKKSQVWHRNIDTDVRVASDLTVDLDYAAWEYFVADALSKREFVRHFMHDHILEVNYTDLVKNWDSEIARVQNFLGLAPRPLIRKTLPTASSDCLTRINNLYEVRMRYKDTPLEKYFYRFTDDWFTCRIPKWKKHLQHLVGTPARYMEIGAYEGRATTWMLNNILTHKNSVAAVIEPGYSLSGTEALEINLLGYPQYVHLIKKPSETLADIYEAELPRSEYEFIYVDGDHRSESTYRDGMNAYKLLAPGGLICFDDYLFPYSAQDGTHPGVGIDRCIAKLGSKVEIVDSGYQVWVRKT